MIFESALVDYSAPYSLPNVIVRNTGESFIEKVVEFKKGLWGDGAGPPEKTSPRAATATAAF